MILCLLSSGADCVGDGLTTVGLYTWDRDHMTREKPEGDSGVALAVVIVLLEGLTQYPT